MAAAATVLGVVFIFARRVDRVGHRGDRDRPVVAIGMTRLNLAVIR